MFKELPQIGITGKYERIVEYKYTAEALGSGGVKVFATPAMIGLMEQAALNLIQPYLEEGYSTVGLEVNVKHIKATPMGQNVYAVAKLVKIDDKKLTFEVEAYDEEGKIGFGSHRRYIINVEEFLKNIYGE